MFADRLNPSLDWLRLKLAQSALPDAWATMSAALLGLLPATWRQALLDRRAELGLRLDADALAVLQLQAGRARVLEALPLDAPEVLAALQARLQTAATSRWLLLDAGSVLRRTLRLPLAAEPRLREVLGHEIDRQTPFTGDQVAYAGRVLAREVATRQLQVELIVVPNARLDAALQALGPLAEGLAGVDVLEGERCLGVNLLPAARRQRQSDPTRRRQLELLACAVILGFAGLLVSLNNRREALQILHAQVEAAQAEVREVRALRNQLQASAQAANFLAQTRAAQPTMLELVADLTRRIPDDTALDKLAVNDGKLVLVGLSKAPAALPQLLKDSPLLVSPALAGAVQSDPRSGRDRFTLTATVTAAQPEAADARR